MAAPLLRCPITMPRLPPPDPSLIHSPPSGHLYGVKVGTVYVASDPLPRLLERGRITIGAQRDRVSTISTGTLPVLVHFNSSAMSASRGAWPVAAKCPYT